MRTAVVGGGAAGFFLAINLKELCPQMEVTIFEKSRKVLAKVEVVATAPTPLPPCATSPRSIPVDIA